MLFYLDVDLAVIEEVKGSLNEIINELKPEIL